MVLNEPSPELDAPGTKRYNCENMRPFKGRFETSRVLTFAPMLADDVSTSASALEATVTLSLSVAGCKWTSSTRVCPADSGKSETTDAANPDALVVTL